MSSYSRSDVVLVRYPFSDLSGSKIRPAVVVSAPHISKDIIIVPLTSKTSPLLAGEFVLADWSQVGLNVESAVKRGVYTVHSKQLPNTSAVSPTRARPSLKRGIIKSFASET